MNTCTLKLYFFFLCRILNGHNYLTKWMKMKKLKRETFQSRKKISRRQRFGAGESEEKPLWHSEICCAQVSEYAFTRFDYLFDLRNASMELNSLLNLVDICEEYWSVLVKISFWMLIFPNSLLLAVWTCSIV